MLEKKRKEKNRHLRIRAKIRGIANRPRLCVFRSSNHIYAQLIDDDSGRVLISANDAELKKVGASKPKDKQDSKDTPKTRKVGIAFEVGKLIAKKALVAKIEKVIFDRKGYKYHGRVKAVAEGARAEGLKF